MKRVFWTFLAVVITVPAAAENRANGTAPNARQIVERMLAGLGGADAPYRTESIAFTFAVEREGEVVGSRRHCWHPQTGAHVLSRTTPAKAEGDKESKLYIDWNLDSGDGLAIRDGVELEGDELAEVLDSARKMWINDTYWLLMPYKLLDPGVSIAHDGMVTEGERTFDKIKVTFDGVGVTPGDTYWAWIARDNGRMERWSYVLEGREPPPTAWDWKDFAYHGPLQLSPRKQRVDGDMAILTHKIVVR